MTLWCKEQIWCKSLVRKQGLDTGNDITIVDIEDFTINFYLSPIELWSIS
jgi:hypothetical protein